MKRIEKEDQRRGTVTYQLDDGRYVTLDETLWRNLERIISSNGWVSNVSTGSAS
jgi:hypothetical protein